MAQVLEKGNLIRVPQNHLCSNSNLNNFTLPTFYLGLQTLWAWSQPQRMTLHQVVHQGGGWLAWLKHGETISVDFKGSPNLHWQVSSNKPKLGETPYFHMPFNPVKCHSQWRSFACPKHDQTPSANLPKPLFWPLLLFPFTSNSYHT